MKEEEHRSQLAASAANTSPCKPAEAAQSDTRVAPAVQQSDVEFTPLETT
jgi:hypothetical protein